MRASLTALTEELRRLKATGVRELSVPPETVARLRTALAKRKTAKPEAAPERVARLADQPETASVPFVREVTQIKPTSEPVFASPVPILTPIPQPKPQLREARFTLPSEGTKAERLAALREIVLADETCRAQLRPGKQVVFGVGNPEAQILFVGEAPGAEEERQGEPFVGPAGKLLTKMIQAMGLEREQVYIANIMNWRPKMPTENAAGEQVGNRPPTPEEMAYCLPFLRAQLEIVAPQVIVALGATAARGLLGHDSFKALGELRGKWREFAGCPLMVTYHPSYILRNQSNRSKRVIWEDFLKVMERAALPISERQRGYFL